MDMDMPVSGIPWLPSPITLHSSREYSCSLNTTEQCAYQQGYWRFWYNDDYRYALPTLTFFLVGIALFSIPHLLSMMSNPDSWRSRPLRRLIAVNRYLSYRAFRLPALNWNSAPIGVLFLGAVGVIYFFSMTLGPKPYYWPSTEWGGSPPIATRSGWMSLACLPFIIATSSKSNFISALTGVGHEKLQVFHRWISYASFVLALIHTFPFIIIQIGEGTMVMSWKTDAFYWTGVVALVCQAWLTFASMSPLRSLCYEFFKFTHFLAALLFVLFFFFHCDFTLTSADYFIATAILFSLTWLHSQLRIYFEHGFKPATISLASNGFITVAVPTTSTWVAGQHYFIRFLGLSLHSTTTHPFSVCSLPAKETHGSEVKESTLVFYIRPQGGFTSRLAKYAEKHPNATMRVLLDGPYGGINMRKLASSPRILAIAGGSGAGWLIPLIEAFIRRQECLNTGNDDAAPSMRVILATRDLLTRTWFSETIQSLLLSHSSTSSGHSGSGLSVEIYYTGGEENEAMPKLTGQFLQKLEDPENAPESDSIQKEASQVHNTEKKALSDSKSSSLASPSEHAKPSSVPLVTRDHVSRPNLATVIREVAEREGAADSMAVFLCGPKGMQSEVANAVAGEQVKAIKGGGRDVYLHMEHFSWA